MVFGFGTGCARKFSLLEDGDFCFLDGLMGGRWDVKLGKDVDSFFKCVTLVEVSRTRDFLLVCNVKFSESKCLFSGNYRTVCKNSILERKREMGVSDIA